MTKFNVKRLRDATREKAAEELRLLGKIESWPTAEKETVFDGSKRLVKILKKKNRFNVI